MIILEIKKEIWEVDKFIMTRKQMVAKLFKNKTMQNIVAFKYKFN